MKNLFEGTALDIKLKEVKLLKEVEAWLYAFDKEVQDYVLYYLLQKTQLIDKGVDEFGNVIGRYSSLTEEINPNKKTGTPYTFLDTGEFFNSMFIKVMNDGFEIDGDGNKTNFLCTIDLFEIYGDRIIGLTEQSMDALRNEIKIRMIRYARKSLQID